MGGGDLNLKKSWHPSTLRNIERVWKAEQKHEVEKQKIEQLQKELAEERAREEIQAYAEDQGVVKKKEQRLDWMYQGPAALVDREDYLMGRKIDKTFELMQQQEIGVDKSKEEAFDVTAVSSSIGYEASSSMAGVDLANKIREDPLFNIMKKEKEQRKDLLCNPVKMKQLQQMLQESLKKKSKKEKKSEKHSKGNKHKKSHKSEENHSHSSKNGSYDRQYRHYEDKHRDRPSHDSKNRQREDRRRHSEKYHSTRDEEVNNKKKLDAEERDRRLREMQENAEWREKQRKRNTKMYQEEEERESKAPRVDSEHFIKPLLAKEAGKGSLENRIRQKIFTIQRGSSVMDKNFVRR